MRRWGAEVASFIRVWRHGSGGLPARLERGHDDVEVLKIRCFEKN
jgi:hypothetical protein